MNYVDKYGLYNVKPVGPDGEPTGNDGAIITAYAKKAGLPVDKIQFHLFLGKLKVSNGFPVERLPGKETPYPSRDFLLGITAMDFGSPEFMRSKKWNFSPLPLPKFNLIAFIIQALACIGEHRNFFWEHELRQIYRVAFMVPFQDRAFYWRGEWPGLLYWMIAWVDKKLPGGNNSSKLIRWLKYDITPDLKVFVEYFGEDHPITVQMARRLVA